MRRTFTGENFTHQQESNKLTEMFRFLRPCKYSKIIRWACNVWSCRIRFIITTRTWKNIDVFSGSSTHENYHPQLTNYDFFYITFDSAQLSRVSSLLDSLSRLLVSVVFCDTYYMAKRRQLWLNVPGKRHGGFPTILSLFFLAQLNFASSTEWNRKQRKEEKKL